MGICSRKGISAASVYSRSRPSFGHQLLYDIEVLQCQGRIALAGDNCGKGRLCLTCSLDAAS